MQQAELAVPRHATTLRGLLEDRLRGAILNGHYVPGQRLVERELCETFGVGRTSIREGLRQLEAEGLVTIVPHRGPSVSTMTYEEAEQLYALRAVLEAFVGQLFAERGTAEDMDRLSAAVEAFEEASRADDRGTLLSSKTALYAVLTDGTGNVFVRQTLGLLHNRVNLLRMTSMMQPGRLAHSVTEIREMHDAIRARDGARAAAACRRHVEMAARAALAQLRRKVP